jgi:periplasmic protein TonB
MGVLPEINPEDAVVPVVDAPVAFDLDIVVPCVAIEPDAANGSAWRWSLMAALVLHVGVIAAFAWPNELFVSGGGGIDLEAISVDLVPASAIDAIVMAQVKTATPPPSGRLNEREGSDRQIAAVVEAPDAKREITKDVPLKAAVADLVIPDVVVKPELLMPDVPSIVIAPTTVERPVDAPDPLAPDPAAKVEALKPIMPPVDSAPAEALAGEQFGGTTARGVSVVEMAAQSSAIASVGEIGAYGRLVQKAVAGNPPRPPRNLDSKGEVVVTFALQIDGTLAYARISKSSGSMRLDDLALAAVRSTQFPPPPRGVKIAQLIYNFPVKFR